MIILSKINEEIIKELFRLTIVFEHRLGSFNNSHDSKDLEEMIKALKHIDTICISQLTLLEAVKYRI